MDEKQSLAFKLCLKWEELCAKEFPNENCAKLRKTGDPRKSNLFRWMFKLVREIYGLVPDNEYGLYILSQLHVLKVNHSEDGGHGRIEPNCLCGNRAWRRWKLWKSIYDKKSKASHTTVAIEDNPNILRLKKELLRTKEYLQKKGVTNLEGVNQKLDDYSLIRWITNAKVHPIWAILSPLLTQALGERSLEEVFNFDFVVYSISITDEVRDFFREEFSYESTTL